jgi:glycosyltransferase involved in cell wall biosynthesis
VKKTWGQKKSSRKHRKKERQNLSVCMVVKDEESRMATFIDGLKGLAQEVVVVDTGSRDWTVEVAKRMGAKVERCIWNDDFSEVRNASLHHATGDWVLILDADEAIHPRDFDVLRKTFETGNAAAYRLLTRNYSDLVYAAGWRSCSGEYPEMEMWSRGWYPTIKVRLFRRSEGIHFRGCVHELVESSIFESGGIIDNCSIPIHHATVPNEKAKREKDRFYLRLGRKKIEQQPHDPRAHFELGVLCLGMGRLDEAEAMLRSAVALQDKKSKAELIAVYHQPSETYNMLGVTLERLGRPQDALAQYQNAVDFQPRCVGALTNWGLLMEKQGRLREAQEKYRAAIEIDPDNVALKNHLIRINILLDKEGGAQS